MRDEWACEAFVLIFQFAVFVENGATVVTSMSQRSERVIPAGRQVYGRVLPGYPLGYGPSSSTTTCAGGRFGRDGPGLAGSYRVYSRTVNRVRHAPRRAPIYSIALSCNEAPKRTRVTPTGSDRADRVTMVADASMTSLS